MNKYLFVFLLVITFIILTIVTVLVIKKTTQSSSNENIYQNTTPPVTPPTVTTPSSSSVTPSPTPYIPGVTFPSLTPSSTPTAIPTTTQPVSSALQTLKNNYDFSKGNTLTQGSSIQKGQGIISPEQTNALVIDNNYNLMLYMNINTSNPLVYYLVKNTNFVVSTLNIDATGNLTFGSLWSGYTNYSGSNCQQTNKKGVNTLYITDDKWVLPLYESINNSIIWSLYNNYTNSLVLTTNDFGFRNCLLDNLMSYIDFSLGDTISSTSSTNYLVPGKGIMSPSRNNALVMTTNGVLILYINITKQQVQLYGLANGVNKLVMQTDGNMCVYNDSTSLWCSLTYSAVCSQKGINFSITDTSNVLIVTGNTSVLWSLPLTNASSLSNGIRTC